ncbi:hypothetical protein [Pseudoalteromonas maricaloris]|uniref:hypothetical protein n=1 Tax=Pseudoalteromonas maricaloris TaxID=184924 RepID=UPI00057E9F64|nr:hypothetical protein [Pseudoalteromonas flavipulchra]KID35256.1 hypothetical protein QT15_13420 [Pseudoalteromonas flavipulchra NCIMB 2033 = ATCC BAA-314]MBD0780508.1 hypothetical protein [Pseudoalteromonas flavipulchra]MBE0375292.1 hypothetical protein [Pseudoalteromonas flavipulchra NCIMB 2033 = ATCC BAA-314]
MESLILGPSTIAFGAITAALIAGCFSFINLVNAKEQKVSEFRQAWIDELRRSISDYISALSYISVIHKNYREESDTKSKYEMTKDIESIYLRVNSAYNDILFRVNAYEREKHFAETNEKFLSALEESRDLYNASDYLGALKLCDDIRSFSKPLLKNEWERVKTGEPDYVKAKNIAKKVLVAGVILAVIDFAFIASSALLKKSNVNEQISEEPASNKKMQPTAKDGG